MINIFGFACHMVSAATIQLYHCGMKSSHKQYIYTGAWLGSIKLFTKTDGRLDLATGIICQPLLQKVVMTGDLNCPQFNHLLSYVGQTSTTIYAKKPKKRGHKQKEERENNLAFKLEFNQKILGAKVIRNSLVRKTRIESRQLCYSTGQRRVAAYSSTTQRFVPCSQRLLKRGPFLDMIMVESQPD